MKKILCGLFLLLFPTILLADGLTPPISDLSMVYLSTIFGVVDGVLHGTGSQVLGTLFGAFNATVLVMASVILSYVLFTSVLNTAHEGEFLGKKHSSIWVPLRTVTGIGLLLPKATGYSFVQVLVMWVVVQGVGAADQVWNVALDYMNRDGTIVEPIQSIHSDDNPNNWVHQGTADITNSDNNDFLVREAGSVLKSEVCMQTVHNALVNQSQKNSDVHIPDFMTSLAVTGKSATGKNTGLPIDYTKDIGGFITFPGKLPGTFAKMEGMCGNISWTFIRKDSGEVANPAQLSANDSSSIATRQFTLDLQTLAQSIANKLVPPLYPDKKRVPLVTLSASDPVFTIYGLVDTADDYFAIIKPALRSLHDGDLSKYKQFIVNAKNAGWILAGSYYYRMASLNQQLRKLDVGHLDQRSISPSFTPEYDSGLFGTIKDPNVIVNLKTNLPSNKGVVDDYIASETSASKNNNNPPEAGGNDGSGGDQIKSDIIASIIGRVADFQKTLADNLNKKDEDPIFALADLGNNLIYTIESAWMVMLDYIAATTLVGTAIGAASGFWTPAIGPVIMQGLSVATSLITPLLSAWMASNFALGATLSYYVPFIPFFLFIFGAVNWFAVVIEAVLAAPLVALGITHPEGHDLLGKAEQSIMLLVSVFLRPLLMVFGFIFGIILSYVGLSLFNQGFSIASQFLSEYNGDFLRIVTQTTTMAIYVSAVLAIVNRTFSMIYEVPNKVLRWIGGPQENGQEEAMMQGIRGQQEKVSSSIGDKASSATASETNAAPKTGMKIGGAIKDLQALKNSSAPKIEKG